MNQIQKQKSEYLQRKAMKEQVEDLEIRARKWKAEWEIMYYSMEVKNLMPKYNEFREQQLKELQDALSQASEQGIVKEENTDANGQDV